MIRVIITILIVVAIVAHVDLIIYGYKEHQRRNGNFETIAGISISWIVVLSIAFVTCMLYQQPFGHPIGLLTYIIVSSILLIVTAVHTGDVWRYLNKPESWVINCILIPITVGVMLFASNRILKNESMKKLEEAIAKKEYTICHADRCYVDDPHRLNLWYWDANGSYHQYDMDVSYAHYKDISQIPLNILCAYRTLSPTIFIVITDDPLESGKIITFPKRTSPNIVYITNKNLFNELVRQERSICEANHKSTNDIYYE